MRGWTAERMATRIERPRGLRRKSTEAERRLWSRLRSRQLDGLKFRRQFPISPYVVDFVCWDSKLVVEVDGGQHGGTDDAVRDRWLRAQGFEVLRIWNNDVMENLDGVLETVLRHAKRTEAG